MEWAYRVKEGHLIVPICVTSHLYKVLSHMEQNINIYKSLLHSRGSIRYPRTPEGTNQKIVFMNILLCLLESNGKIGQFIMES